MPNYNPLNWQNENSLSNYPFAQALDVNSFIVDANFIQFNQTIPFLDYIIVNENNIVLSIRFDYGIKSDITFLKSEYIKGEAYRYLKIYHFKNDRYLGTITFGAGAADLWEAYVGRKLTVQQYFLAQTVRSIPLNDAVYTLDYLYGDIELNKNYGISSIFYNTYVPADEEFEAITFNAVYGNSPILNDPGVLRKINLVGPVDNNINLASNDVIKINTPDEDFSYLTIGLVSGKPDKSFSIPTLIS
jgi:hypothetical protein